MALHPVLQGISDATAHVRAIDNTLTDAYYQAVGAAADNDTDTPSLVAVFKTKRLVFFQMDQSVLDYYKQRHANGDELALDEFNTYINMVVIRAWQEFQADFNARIDGVGSQ